MKTILFFHTSRRQAWQKELAGAYRFARARKWRLQVVEPTPHPPSIPTLIDFWKPLGCLVECSGETADYFDPAAFGRLPAVFIGRDPRTLPRTASFVNPSNRGPGRCAAQELLTAGFTSFGFVASGGNHFWSRDREAEFRRTLWTNGYPCRVFGRAESFRTPRARGEALREWLRALPRPCGVFAENDYAAGEVLDLAGKLRLRVPKSLAVIGADNDSSLCENTTPPLSSILLDFEQAGYRAAKILSSLIDTPRAPPVRETYSVLGLIRRDAGIPTPGRNGLQEGDRPRHPAGDPARALRARRAAPPQQGPAARRHRRALRLADGERPAHRLPQALRHVHARMAGASNAPRGPRRLTVQDAPPRA